MEIELEELKKKYLTDVTLPDGTIKKNCFVMALDEDLKAFVYTLQTYSFYWRERKRGKELFRLSQLLDKLRN